LEEIDYDKLLNDWADGIFKLLDEANNKKDAEDFGTPEYYRNFGRVQAFSESLSQLSFLEKRRKGNYIKNQGGDINETH
jgi:hypothetical protein